MIGLLRFYPSLRVGDMRFLRLRTAFLGSMLALLAVLGMTALTGWHSATFHDDDLRSAAFVQHEDGAKGQTDSDGPVHLAAHVVGEGILATTQAAAPLGAPVATRPWPSSETVLGTGADPVGLLRPPRA